VYTFFVLQIYLYKCPYIPDTIPGNEDTHTFDIHGNEDEISTNSDIVTNSYLANDSKDQLVGKSADSIWIYSSQARLQL
jgi:hypothetical protein